jgi:undecaprenyl phosphate N,N'-diacetylbacillosamine 1-phosphate transferase
MSAFYRRYGKRLLDVGLVLITCPVSIPSSILTAFGVRILSGSPVLYRSTRLGQDQVEFTMFKFRTMHVDAPDLRNSDGTTFSSADDPRVTPVGRFLRATSLDELPQLYNVLRGEMSLVGPRPSPPASQRSFKPADFARYSVRPGVTGLSQATLRNEGTLQERLDLDRKYVTELSLALDLKILWATIGRVLTRRGVHRSLSHE